MLNRLELLKTSKGYKAGEPALVEFETLIEILETRDNLLKEVAELETENKKLRDQLKKERVFNAQKERDYLLSLQKLDHELDLANIKASQFLAADLNRKIKNKKEKEIEKEKKILTKTDLLLGAHHEH